MCAPPFDKFGQCGFCKCAGPWPRNVLKSFTECAGVIARDCGHRQVTVQLDEKFNGTRIFRDRASASITLLLPASERGAQRVPGGRPRSGALASFSARLKMRHRWRINRFTLAAPFQ